ncbi:uracil-DNA glycosylase [Actibacterium atlanticum]|uniref:Uracil-DNA glycosylase n=1 Tax=Actibacterium atlanticum TaxID=1461693 RepID=A0A058ZL18_9RHOB|nr:uracil-DNA glycosylase family protein [Actibacterium atlanticum]KCV81897.1 uracil-DNA glycosylase [Actibacterium atlanticum]
MSQTLDALTAEIGKCQLCAERFAATATAHRPRPVTWLHDGAPILIAGQAPGNRVYKEGKPFFDASGDRLRDWMGVSADQFYDRDLLSVLPMAFCFPGYDAKGSDLPPPPICRNTWHDQIRTVLGQPKLTLLVGGYAQKYFLGATAKAGVTATVAAWRDHAPRVFPLPHPSWRNTAWLKKNPWFMQEVLPALRLHVQEILND